MTDHELIANIHRRLDKQDELLREMRDMIVEHTATEERLRPHLEELVALWRGSRVIAAILTSVVAMIGAGWAAISWAKNYIK